MLTTIPAEWPLRVMSSFLSRSFRRTLHDHHESQLVKAISASENLAVADRTWRILREEGAVIEEPVEGDNDEGVDGGAEGGLAEKVGLALQLNEKVGLHDDDAHGTGDAVVDLT